MCIDLFIETYVWEFDKKNILCEPNKFVFFVNPTTYRNLFPAADIHGGNGESILNPTPHTETQGSNRPCKLLVAEIAECSRPSSIVAECSRPSPSVADRRRKSPTAGALATLVGDGRWRSGTVASYRWHCRLSVSALRGSRAIIRRN